MGEVVGAVTVGAEDRWVAGEGEGAAAAVDLVEIAEAAAVGIAVVLIRSDARFVGICNAVAVAAGIEVAAGSGIVLGPEVGRGPGAEMMLPCVGRGVPVSVPGVTRGRLAIELGKAFTAGVVPGDVEVVVFELPTQDVDSSARAAAVALMSRSLPSRPGCSRSGEIAIVLSAAFVN